MDSEGDFTIQERDHVATEAERNSVRDRRCYATGFGAGRQGQKLST